jgi:hypothetical protein
MFGQSLKGTGLQFFWSIFSLNNEVTMAKRAWLWLSVEDGMMGMG